MPCCYGHVIEDAKAHAAIGHGMMARRPHQGKSAVKAVQYSVHCLYGASCSHESGMVGVFGENRVDIQMASSVLADGFDLIDVALAVYGGDLAEGGSRGSDAINFELL